MPEKPERTSRPLAVTIMAYLLYAGGLAYIVFSFTGYTAAYGRFYPAAQVLIMLVMFAALAGVMSMEKWGAWLFLVAIAARVLLDFQVGAVHPASLLLLVPAAVFIRHLLMPKKD
jgi:hypothetical protein